jgi:hypothetical protein
MKLTADQKTTTLTAETPAEALELFKFYQASLGQVEAKPVTLQLPTIAQPKRKYTKHPNRKNKMWSDAELELILPLSYKKSCGHGEVARIAKKLKRTASGVSGKLLELRKTAVKN